MLSCVGEGRKLKQKILEKPLEAQKKKPCKRFVYKVFPWQG